MTEAVSVAMVVSAGLFAGSVALIAWERAPSWGAADAATFKRDFASTIRRVDRLEPILLVLSIASSIIFAISATGTPRTLSAVAAACYVAVLAGSAAVLVPLQGQLTDPEANLSATDIQRGRSRWLRGHLLRSMSAVAAFVLLVVAAVG